ncbi:MAG: hypothetical protein AB8U25_01845 [Rickettsiales endosymbiont of Dermacentor nuttalli]
MPVNLSDLNNKIFVSTGDYEVTLGKLISINNNTLLKTGMGNLVIGKDFNHLGDTDIRSETLTLHNVKLAKSPKINVNGELRGIGKIIGNIDNLGKIYPQDYL